MTFIMMLRKPLAILFLMFALYNAWSLKKVAILFVEKVSTNNYVIAVDHLPLTDRDKINWFNNNLPLLQRYNISINDFDHITIMEAVGGFKNINSPWVDDYYCFNRIGNNYRCVDKNLQTNVFRAHDGTLTFYIHSFGGIYVQGTDGSVLKSNYERYFDDLNDRLGESLDRWFFR